MTDVSPAPRPAGKRGKRPAVHVPALKLSLFRAAVQAAPATGDVTHGITDWGMDGNDQYGDCGPAATDHYQVAKSGDTAQINKLGGVGPVPLYFEYGTAQGEPGPDPDQGVDNATWLKFLFDKGVIEAYAELDHTNVAEVHQAMLDFSGVLIGVKLTDDAEQLFSAHEPWTLANGEAADPSEGHDILLAKYDDTYDYFVTWGGLQPATIPWDSSCIDEAWVIVTAADAARAGVDMTSLVEQIKALGGTAAPSLTPPAAPPAAAPPEPPAPPAPEHEAWWEELLEAAASWLDRHRLGSSRADAQALLEELLKPFADRHANELDELGVKA